MDDERFKLLSHACWYLVYQYCCENLIWPAFQPPNHIMAALFILYALKVGDHDKVIDILKQLDDLSQEGRVKPEEIV